MGRNNFCDEQQQQTGTQRCQESNETTHLEFVEMIIFQQHEKDAVGSGETKVVGVNASALHSQVHLCAKGADGIPSARLLTTVFVYRMCCVKTEIQNESISKKQTVPKQSRLKKRKKNGNGEISNAKYRREHGGPVGPFERVIIVKKHKLQLKIFTNDE